MVRASWVRRVEGEVPHLFERLEQSPVVGEHRLWLGQRGGAQDRRARQVELELRALRVELQALRQAEELGRLAVNAVLARERHAPRGQEPLCWLLLNSEPVNDAAAVRQVLGYYARRWRVEEFHKAWKSGNRVEERRMQAVANLERMVVILAFIAVRLPQLRELFTEDSAVKAATLPKVSCAGVLQKVEWQVL